MKKAVLSFIVFLILTGMALSENRAIHFKRITIDDGLSQSAIFCFMQDRKGFLWIGTQDGLNKYDGYNFNIFKPDPDDTNSLSHNWITALCEDDSGNIWIGTQGGGLNKFDPKREKFYWYPFDETDPHCLNSGIINTIYQDTAGAIWIGTEGGGLGKLTVETDMENQGIKKERITNYKHIPGNPHSLNSDIVSTILEDRAGILWVGTENGLDKFDRNSGSFAHYTNNPEDPSSLSHDSVKSIYEDNSGLLWIGTTGGLNLMDKKTGIFTRYRHKSDVGHSLSHDRISSIIEDQSGILWISTLEGGLNKFNKRTGTFTHYRHIPDEPSSLSFDNIQCIYEDRSGIIWIGTSGKGLNKFDRQDNFELYRRNPNNPNSLSDNYVYAVCEDRSGIVWIGTASGLLNKLDRKTGTFTHFRSNPINSRNLPLGDIRSILEDSTGVLWVGTLGSGLNRFDRSSGTFTSIQPITGDSGTPPVSGVLAIYEDSSGLLWIGTSLGLHKFNRETGMFTHYCKLEKNPNSLGDDYIIVLYERPTDPGILWVGTRNGGLNRFDTRKEIFTRFTANRADPHSLSVNFVLSIYEDSAGTLWVGTHGGGLNKLIGQGGEDGKARFIHYTEKNGLPNNTIYGILEDSNGHLWMSTNKGISKFISRSEAFKNYTIRDGLQGNEFNGGAYFKSKGGEMFFGGVNGLNTFYPADIKMNRHVPPIVLTDFKISNKPVKIGDESPLKQSITWTKKLKLSHRQNDLSFEFIALDFIAPEKNQYAYMMSGLEKDWNYTDSRKRFAFYTNLDPGKYVFLVRGSNNDGIWNNEGAALKITITPPWWQTWWFRVPGILIVLVLIATIYKTRTYRLRKRSKELEEINAALNTQIKARKRLEEKLVRQEKLAVLGQLAGGIAHELRNPLGAIKNSVYFLGISLEDSDTDIKESLQILDKEIKNSERTISSLLDYAAARPPSKRRVNIKERMQDVLSRLNVPESIEVHNRIADPIPEILADPDQLSQVFGNILLNSIQAMPEGGQLVIHCEIQDPDWLTISITDTGVGIPAENIPKIFEPLFTGKAKGIGLGMAITRTFVEGHGGSIEVESEIGKGTTITIKLPMEKTRRAGVVSKVK